MLIALSITATLLAASLAALDTSFKSYKHTTEGASSNVVTRIVMYRVMAMIRTGTEFAPYPDDPIDNPIIEDSDYIQFVTLDDESTGKRQVVTLERRSPSSAENGPFELWYIQTDFVDGVQTAQVETPLIANLQDVRFTLEYDVGPRLTRATVDLCVNPNDVQDARIHSDVGANTIRLVSSAVPRRLIEER